MIIDLWKLWQIFRHEKAGRSAKVMAIYKLMPTVEFGNRAVDLFYDYEYGEGIWHDKTKNEKTR